MVTLAYQEAEDSAVRNLLELQNFKVCPPADKNSHSRPFGGAERPGRGGPPCYVKTLRLTKAIYEGFLQKYEVGITIAHLMDEGLPLTSLSQTPDI